MGLGIKSFEDTLDFVKKHPKVLLLTLFPALTYLPIALFQETAPILLLMVLVSLPLFIFFSILVAGAFPVIIQFELKSKKWNLKKAISISLRKFGKILIANIFLILVFGILFLIPIVILMFGASFYFTPLVILSIILFLALLIFTIFVSFRLSVVIPILVVEEKGVIESIKKSWKITKGHVLSIFVGLFLLSLIVTAITLPLNLLGIALNYFRLEEFYIVVNGVRSVISQTLISAFFNTFASLFYFKLKSSGKKI